MDKPWKEKGIQMIQNLTKLTDLLIDYRSVLNEENSRDKQTTCVANLLHFYKVIFRLIILDLFKQPKIIVKI